MTVTEPIGFRAAGVAAGIKSAGGLDLALIAAERPVTAAGVFTKSVTAAAPVALSRRRLSEGRGMAVILNSGCANAGTGAEGEVAVELTTERLASELGCDSQVVLAASTGPIGKKLDVELFTAAIPQLVGSLDETVEAGLLAASAIMTTDSRPKQSLVKVGDATLGGIAKGAGMIRPDMATMLAVLTTDLIVDSDDFRVALGKATDVTFNCLNVDGCQSTNDSVIALASGESGVRVDPQTLEEAIESLCRDLVRQMAEDAEGATKVVKLLVTGTAGDDEARRLGMTVADSALVRASFFGADPNWGRVLGALGVAGVRFDPSALEIAYDGETVCSRGVGVDVDEDGLAVRLKGDFTVAIKVGDGPGSAEVTTTDLTPDYVRFNGDRS